ncbi:DUF2254 domain-containing protein [Coralloluteibacterium stylophorae]|uniref:DUF2254 domain-containing protein n=1 Tax=Coralloluteibacterium stylophorae TaxID=1776034 RepID=A0A8J7VQJ4_9GAMM|nr:DUF2254 domain-containing protein [Coralloluteibacterium stylophorae]MBS7456848.1 DUF2254 domain-containing protein [Coralloluteibacterium stylophorae]
MGRRLSSGASSKLAIDLRASFWFLPMLSVVAAVALAVGMVALDRWLGDGLARRWPILLAADADGARELMSTVAGSMITVAGVVFSITIVALVQASTQYTSRVLRNFMRDRRNQVVLGLFLGVFAYCLGVMRAITTNGDGGFVPHLAVLAGEVLVLVAIAVLATFIHHVAASIQSGAVARSIANDTLHTIEAMFPDALEGDDVAPGGQGDAGLRWYPVPAPGLGYIESVDLDRLLDFARAHDVVVRMERSVGDFASPDRPIASIGTAHAPDPDAMRGLAQLFAIGSYRTIEQDVGFGIRQLVDVALKGLSPAINDTTTAVTSLDYLSVILRRLAGRRIEPRPLHDGGALRVVPMGPGFERLLALGLDQIRENAHGNTAVLLRLLQAIEQIRSGTRSPERLRMLDAKREVVAEVARRTASCSEALRLIEQQLAGATAACDETTGA